ncbi:hypothetical protein ACJ6WE_13690 [Streptomyces sp. MMS24-I31]|uniref:hypothetical protein n=1 Tax=Streptomyces sp. MMS24-I31 TaxID=3351563 RepID=UPI003896AD1B
MTARIGEPFVLGRVLSYVDGLLGGYVPGAGPTTSEGEPVTGEWTMTRGEGFVFAPLWESDSLVGVYAPDWNEAELAVHDHLAALVEALDHRWGPHRVVGMRVPLFRRIAGEAMPPLFEALSGQDFLGDLTVWGPLPAGPERSPRWLAVSLNQSDGDAPVIVTAVVTDHPVIELQDD